MNDINSGNHYIYWAYDSLTHDLGHKMMTDLIDLDPVLFRLAKIQDLGHKMMADLAVWLFQQTALDLILRPMDEEDRELTEEGLPGPVFEGGSGSGRCSTIDSGSVSEVGDH